MLRLVRGTLLDAEISSGQLRALAEALGFDEENLRFADLPRDRGNVLSENIAFFSSLQHGGKKSLASKLGIDPTRVSRWLSGNFDPNRPLCDTSYLNLDCPREPISWKFRFLVCRTCLCN